MQPSMFNVQVPIADRNEVFLMNTFSDAQLLVSPEVTSLLDRVKRGDQTFTSDEETALAALAENGFVVESREKEQEDLRQYFRA
jgi:hypothetical protein